MKIGVLGSGDVAQTLAAGFARHGHDTMIGTRDRAKLADWAAKNRACKVGTFSDTATFGEAVVLAVKGTAAADALRAAGAANLAGKVVIDATNPIADDPPVNGVLKFFTGLDESLMERLQREFAKARFVKAFNSVGNGLMVNPSFAGGIQRMDVDQRIVMQDLRVMARDKSHTTHICSQSVNLVNALCRPQTVFPASQIEKLELVGRRFAELRHFNVDAPDPIALALQICGQMAADETTRTCNQNACLFTHILLKIIVVADRRVPGNYHGDSSSDSNSNCPGN